MTRGDIVDRLQGALQALCHEAASVDAIEAAARFLGPVRIGDVHVHMNDPPEVIVQILDASRTGRYLTRCSDEHGGSSRYWHPWNHSHWREDYRGHVADFIAEGLRALTPRALVARVTASREYVFEDADAAFAPLAAEDNPPFPGCFE
jgi:hypothetical protein